MQGYAFVVLPTSEHPFHWLKKERDADSWKSSVFNDAAFELIHLGSANEAASQGACGLLLF